MIIYKTDLKEFKIWIVSGNNIVVDNVAFHGFNVMSSNGFSLLYHNSNYCFYSLQGAFIDVLDRKLVYIYGIKTQETKLNNVVVCHTLKTTSVTYILPDVC